MSKYIHKTNINNPATWLKPDEKLMCGKYDVAWMYVVFADITEYTGYKIDSEGKVWSLWYLDGKYRALGTEWKIMPSHLYDGYPVVSIGVPTSYSNSTKLKIHDLVLTYL